MNTPTAKAGRVADEMTRHPVVIAPHQAAAEAITIMRRAGVRHLPVVDGRGTIVGMLSDRDLLREGLLGWGDDPGDSRGRASQRVAQSPVESVMTRGVHTCRPGDRLGDIAEQMVRRRIDALPVVDGSGALLGIITSTDLLLHIRREEGVLDMGAVLAARTESEDAPDII